MNRTLKYLSGVLLLLVCAVCRANDTHYAVSSIPAELLKKANAVIREDHYEVNIISTHEVRTTERYAVTVLSDKGAEYGKLNELENSFTRVTSIKGWLYDKYGNKLRDLKKREIKTTAPYSYGGVTDVYYSDFDFGYGGYPYTCVYEVETVRNMTFFLPEWEPQTDYDCAVESSDIKVTYPKELSLHYHLFHLPVAPVIRSVDDGYELTAYVKNVPATAEPNDFATNSTCHLPTIVFSSEQFELADRSGSMATWKDLGTFLYQLNASRDVLPDAVKKTVHTLTDTCNNAAAKIDLLYAWLKANTRYVSVQLGIGGWQTFDAQYVASKGYGDCKALSNYMKALLKEAGIPSYQAVVSSGSGSRFSMVDDFPCVKFNHVILCVPGTHDSTWIECTSQTLPAGYLSAFTDNRNVLLLTEHGGFVVRTPKNKPEMNAMERKATFSVDKDQVSGKVTLNYKGYLWEREHAISEMPKTEMVNYVAGKFKNGEFSIAGGAVTITKGRNMPFITEETAVKGDGVISESGVHIFLAPHVFNIMMTPPPSSETLGKSFELRHSYSVADTITYHFAGNYTMDAYERNTTSFPFANYRFKAWLEDGNTVKVAYHYQQIEGAYPVTTYADYVKLYKDINTACSNKLVLSKKD